jgi:hypothetical protein
MQREADVTCIADECNGSGRSRQHFGVMLLFALASVAVVVLPLALVATTLYVWSGCAAHTTSRMSVRTSCI